MPSILPGIHHEMGTNSINLRSSKTPIDKSDIGMGPDCRWPFVRFGNSELDILDDRDNKLCSRTHCTDREQQCCLHRTSVQRMLSNIACFRRSCSRMGQLNSEWVVLDGIPDNSRLDKFPAGILDNRTACTGWAQPFSLWDMQHTVWNQRIRTSRSYK